MDYRLLVFHNKKYAPIIYTDVTRVIVTCAGSSFFLLATNSDKHTFKLCPCVAVILVYVQLRNMVRLEMFYEQTWDTSDFPFVSETKDTILAFVFSI